MAYLISEENLLDAWIHGAVHVLKSGPMLNLSLEVTSPDRRGGDGTIATRIDRFLEDAGQMPVHTVAETIFPAAEYRRHGIQGVFDVYPDQTYPNIEPHPKVRWGTYAHRLVRRKDTNGNQVNPLKHVIDALKQELRQRGPMSSRYELGLLDIPIYDQTADGTRRMGAPCLSHLSFKLFEKAIHLTAFYRSHDYSYKVFGNLLGLARLQACVAFETGQRMGNLVVHSSYAWATPPKVTLRACIEDIRNSLRSQEKGNVLAE